MTTEEKVNYWLCLANESLDDAKALLENKQLLFAGFACHLAVEKALKAAIQNKNVTPPKMHDLGKLAKEAGLFEKLSEEQVLFLGILMPLQIEGRYASYKDNIAMSLNNERTMEIYEKAKEMIKWVQAKLVK